MAVFVIGAMHDHPVHAGDAHFAEGDFLRACVHGDNKRDA
jgi:hypothetical protein